MQELAIQLVGGKSFDRLRPGWVCWVKCNGLVNQLFKKEVHAFIEALELFLDKLCGVVTGVRIG